MIISATDPRLTWLGCIDRQDLGAQGTQTFRLPLADKILFNPDLWDKAEKSAGVRLRFSAATRCLNLRLSELLKNSRPFALLCDDAHVADAYTDASGLLRFPEQDGARHRYEIWFPQNAAPRVLGVECDDGATVEALAAPVKRWLHYGSSISQCVQATSPVLTWPAVVARKRNLDLLCLGFGGHCHLDPLVMRAICAQRADAISLKVGINIYGRASLNDRTFRWNIIAAVRLLREAHPKVSLALISPIFGPAREGMVNRAGFTLAEMRAEVAEAAQLLIAHGDTNLQYMDGLELLGPKDSERLPDFLHPDTEGYARMAERFDAKLGDYLFGLLSK